MRGEKYLTKPQQFASVYRQGGSWASGLLIMRALGNGLTLSRCGFSVSKRVGKAVTRNKVKRRLREILRTMPLKSGRDIVFIVRPAAAGADYTALRSSVAGLLSRAHLLESSAEPGLLSVVKAGNRRPSMT